MRKFISPAWLCDHALMCVIYMIAYNQEPRKSSSQKVGFIGKSVERFSTESFFMITTIKVVDKLRKISYNNSKKRKVKEKWHRQEQNAQARAKCTCKVCSEDNPHECKWLKEVYG